MCVVLEKHVLCKAPKSVITVPDPENRVGHILFLFYKAGPGLRRPGGGRLGGSWLGKVWPGGGWPGGGWTGCGRPGGGQLAAARKAWGGAAGSAWQGRTLWLLWPVRAQPAGATEPERCGRRVRDVSRLPMTRNVRLSHSIHCPGIELFAPMRASQVPLADSYKTKDP